MAPWLFRHHLPATIRKGGVETFSFSNRLNGINPLHSDKMLSENEPNMKKISKTLILGAVLAKCDHFLNMTIFFIKSFSTIAVL